MYIEQVDQQAVEGIESTNQNRSPEISEQLPVQTGASVSIDLAIFHFNKVSNLILWLIFRIACKWDLNFQVTDLPNLGPCPTLYTKLIASLLEFRGN